MKIIKYLFMFLVLIGGIYFIYRYPILEAYTEKNSDPDLAKCPNVLIQKGSKYYLYNSKLVEVPGVNPVVFENLEDYVEFLAWQRSRGVRCPVMYLQQSYDIQGDAVLKVRPSPTEPQGGIPPGLPNYTSGLKTSKVIPAQEFSSTDSMAVPDTITNSNAESTDNLLSPDAMDDNWGGKAYTQKLVDSGAYAGSEVSIQVA